MVRQRAQVRAIEQADGRATARLADGTAGHRDGDHRRRRLLRRHRQARRRASSTRWTSASSWRSRCRTRSPAVGGPGAARLGQDPRLLRLGLPQGRPAHRRRHRRPRARATPPRRTCASSSAGSACPAIEAVQDSGHLTRCRPDRSPLRRGRVIVAGDAAGLLDPWTREGISFALRSGALAGEYAAKGDLDGYVAAVDATLVPDMRAGRTLLSAFTRHAGHLPPGPVHRQGLGRLREDVPQRDLPVRDGRPPLGPRVARPAQPVLAASVRNVFPSSIVPGNFASLCPRAFKTPPDW